MPRNTRDLTNNSNLVPALWPSIIMQPAGVRLTSPLSFFRQVIISLQLKLSYLCGFVRIQFEIRMFGWYKYISKLKT